MNFESLLSTLDCKHFLQIFVNLLVIIDPVAVVPMFLLLTKEDTAEHKKHIAFRSTYIATIILVIFALLGDAILDALAIGEPAFRIAGGLLLLFAAIDMVIVKDSAIRSTTSDENKEASQKADISVFPLAIPLIAGPGAMTTIIMHMRSPEISTSLLSQGLVIVILIFVLLINYYCLVYAERLSKMLGVTGTNVVTRVFGIILAAMAIQFMLNGIQLFVKVVAG